MSSFFNGLLTQLGGPGQAFAIAQTRLGGGRIDHAMRTMAMVKRALRMMCERALSRRTQGDVLANKQLVQQYIADSFIQIEQFRLLVLYTAWRIDKGHRSEARTYIAAVKDGTVRQRCAGHGAQSRRPGGHDEVETVTASMSGVGVRASKGVTSALNPDIRL